MSFVLDEEKTFVQRDFNLDKKLIKALSKLGYTYYYRYRYRYEVIGNK